jgi:tol-pal system protein YbgF
MRTLVPALVALSVAGSLGLGGAGCARADTVADRHISEMRETIGKVQTEQDRENQRFGSMDVAPEDKRAEKTPAPRSQAHPPVRPLRSVQIGQADEPREGDDPDDPNTRPEIRLQGQGGPGVRPVRGKTRGRVEPAEESKTDAAQPSVFDPEAKKSYESALALVNAKQFDKALEALAGFLVRWPDHPYAENAMYWRGECYFARGELLRAAEQFEAVLTRFNGNKAPDALLKIGMCHDRLGAADRAKEYWDRLRRDYPHSDAAKKIPAESKNDNRAGPKESR